MFYADTSGAIPPAIAARMADDIRDAQEMYRQIGVDFVVTSITPKNFDADTYPDDVVQSESGEVGSLISWANVLPVPQRDVIVVYLNKWLQPGFNNNMVRGFRTPNTRLCFISYPSISQTSYGNSTPMKVYATLSHEVCHVFRNPHAAQTTNARPTHRMMVDGGTVSSMDHLGSKRFSWLEEFNIRNNIRGHN